MRKVHYTQGDGAGWALDEDLRQIRSSLGGLVQETGAAGAEIIHAPFWQNLSMVAPSALKNAFVIAHADNPPFFYIKQAEFAWGQRVVDLWVARSREALSQFQQLSLPAEYIPYTIDAGLFFPIADKAALRREFGLPQDAYVIANFHRDTEGADLATPKFQKCPEMMAAVFGALKEQGLSFHVLLAGPRRHWIRRRLEREGIPFTFVGKQGVEGDDFGANILGREVLNKLYNASDLYLIPSRWEGGPQSVMEAAACRCKILSIPLGVAGDLLEPESFFRTPAEAAGIIGEDIKTGSLERTAGPQFLRWQRSHTTESLGKSLRELYAGLGERPEFQAKIRLNRPPGLVAAGWQFRHGIRRRFGRKRLPSRIFWNHQEGENEALDRVMRCVRALLESWKVEVTGDRSSPVEIAGCGQSSGTSPRVQFVVPGMKPPASSEKSVLVAPSVQDVLNLRGRRQTAVVIPFRNSFPDETGEGPLVVEGRDASLRVWGALAAGRPVVYPDDSAYFEQVFHAGVGFGRTRDRASAIAIASQNLSSFAEFIRIPTDKETAFALKTLIVQQYEKF
jgi:glycosyltransferase involved in cell wall biosynthesis